jgi:hypothetical protein
MAGISEASVRGKWGRGKIKKRLKAAYSGVAGTRLYAATPLYAEMKNQRRRV